MRHKHLGSYLKVQPVPLLGLITLIVLAWRGVLTLVAWAAIQFISFQPTFPYSDILALGFGSRWLTSWAHFDGVHYLHLITRGYQFFGLSQVFFPLYPLLIKITSPLHLNPVAVGVALSTLCFTLALYLLFKLIYLDESSEVAKKSLILLLLFPTSFFFTALYTESLFLLLVVSSFYAARRGSWWLAGLFGALAASTRLVGLALIPALMFEWWLQRLEAKKLASPYSFSDFKILLACLLPLTGLAAFMWYLLKTFDDPWLFISAQNSFGTGRETGKLILLYQVFYRYLKMLVTVPLNSPVFYTVVAELAAGIAGLAASIGSWFQTRRSYAVYACLAFIVPTLTGTLASMPRYLLPLFPFFVVAAKTLRPKAYGVWLFISVILLLVNTLLFISGRWVA